MNVKLYNHNSIVGFGKFYGNTIESILKVEPGYIKWCIYHLNHFCVSDEIILEIKSIFSTFEEMENLMNCNSLKLSDYSNQNYYSEDTKPSYGKYSGSYAQDYEGLSDDFIDDVLDGFPEAYWNID